MDSVLISKNISDFLKSKKNSMLEEHYKEFLNCIFLLKEFENASYIQSIHGYHYSNCCWSSNQCKLGPDTCTCYIIGRRLVRIKQLMSLYRKL